MILNIQDVSGHKSNIAGGDAIQLRAYNKYGCLNITYVYVEVLNQLRKIFPNDLPLIFELMLKTNFILKHIKGYADVITIVDFFPKQLKSIKQQILSEKWFNEYKFNGNDDSTSNTLINNNHEIILQNLGDNFLIPEEFIQETSKVLAVLHNKLTYIKQLALEEKLFNNQNLNMSEIMLLFSLLSNNPHKIWDNISTLSFNSNINHQTIIEKTLNPTYQKLTKLKQQIANKI